jgi:GT2 family glycosyltransferase
MLGGKLFRADSAAAGDGIIDSTGIEIYLSRRVKDRDAGTREQDAHKVPDRVFGVCAAAALYKREMLEDVSADGEFFPASFFCYYEDADLAWRAWRRGWEAWFVPAAWGWHRRGGAPVGSRFSRYYTQRNRLWLVARNEPLWKPLAALPALGWHELLLGLRLIRYPYLLKAVWESIRGLPAALRARARLPEINREPPPFHPGSGFSLKELVQALQRKKSCNT